MTSILKADTIQDADGNNIINENSNTITIGASGDTTNIIGTLQNNGSAVGGTNTPTFFAYRSSNQSINDDAATKINFNAELFDSDNTFDASTNYRFTPAVAGKYFIYGMVAIGSGTGVNNAERLFVALYKNGSKYQQAVHDGRNNAYGDTFGGTVNAIIDLDADDYVELYAKFHDGGSAGSNNYYTDSTTFGGFRITGL